MQDLQEATQTIQRLQKAYEDLAVRGLRSVTADQLTLLSAIHEELERVGAAHLAGRLKTLITSIRNDDRGSARALMRAQASLRIFDRILTLETAESQLEAFILRTQFGGASVHAHDENDNENDNENDEGDD